MSTQALSRALLWVVAVGALVGGLLMYRYFRIPPEVRFAEIEARWHFFLASLIALLAIALLLQRGATPGTPSK